MTRKTVTMDGNAAAAYVSYAFSEVATIYPITPSSNMAEEVDRMSSKGLKNLFDDQVIVKEMQSEAGAAGAMHGALTAGTLATTYTASQGLLLMIPNMYKIAGELLPNVIHVSARTVATHALSIFGDHSDVYACRGTGYAMLCSNSPQEVMDFAAVAHLSAIKGRVPFLHFFDGFRTSHEIQKIKAWDYDVLDSLLDRQAVFEFRKRALTPDNPVLRGSSQNDDIYFQAKEASNVFYDEIVNVTENYLNDINKLIGTSYKLFEYYGAPDAENIIVAMGSVCEAIEETVDHLNKNGEKVGLIKVRLYRPFSKKHLLSVMPKSVKKISVLDRAKESGAIGEPLWLDVVAALKGTEFENLLVYGGRYGLSSKDTSPNEIIAVFNNMNSANPKERFTIGINDDVTNLSLKTLHDVDTTPQSMYSAKFWGLGSDGTVSANKNTIKIVGDNSNKFTQGYFAYDSKKSGGLTVSHIRFADVPIKSTYYVKHADFVGCHNQSYVQKYDMVRQIKPGGKFLLNTSWVGDELEKNLPDQLKVYLAKNNVEFYVIDGVNLAAQIGLGGRINTILQSAFFKITEVIEPQSAADLMKKAAKASYGHKGENVVEMNYKAIDAGMREVKKVDVPKAWASLPMNMDEVSFDEKNKDKSLAKYLIDVLLPVNNYKGNDIPVSKFLPYADGSVPQGSAAFERRSTASIVPEWIPENCIQCNLCSYVCPHAVIRPFGVNKEEIDRVPEGQKALDMLGLPDKKFLIGISTVDCTGCENCAVVCPGKKGNKALKMQSSLNVLSLQQSNFDYLKTLLPKAEVLDKFKEDTVKGSQFKKPLLEFNGACAGCGETPYAKLATQLFGDKMIIANATGCSSIWAGSAPSTPYTVNHQGKGPAWHNSLFEDNAEFGYGMAISQKIIRNRLVSLVKKLEDINLNEEVTNLCREYLDTKDDTRKNKVATSNLINKLLELEGKSFYNTTLDIKSLIDKLLRGQNDLSKKSIWIFGGDGWAYDIGFGGLDHVVASGENVNVLVFDTEVYSNTGGQASKSTPYGAIAQFATRGKNVAKKNLAELFMTYKDVYVAQVALGANYNQCIKAFLEAESYNGPSVIIAYSPCISHGIKTGMKNSPQEQKLAVESGYWNLFRYNPFNFASGKKSLIVDSKPNFEKCEDFLKNENRYKFVASSPKSEEFINLIKEKYNNLKKLEEF